MRTPVVLQVRTAQDLVNLNVKDIVDIASVTPGLHVIDAFGSVGTVLFERGIGSGSSANFIDQSVGLNVDGISLSQGAFYGASSFDMERVEVLKGPQGLFYGKSTTAGIVAIHSANPTDSWQSELTAGYELKADEAKFTGFISGPLSESVGIRVAGFYDDTKGWLYNPNPDYEGNPRFPNDSQYGGRVTLQFQNGGPFRARLKVSATRARGNSAGGMLNQGYGCIAGTRQLQPYFQYDNCKIDRFTQGALYSPPYNPDFVAGGPGSPFPRTEDGQPYSRTRTRFAMLEANYDVADDLALTSVSGFAWVGNEEQTAGAFAVAPGFNPPYQLLATNRQRDISQELRLTSSWNDSPINFMIGGLYAPSRSFITLQSYVPAYAVFNSGTIHVKTEVLSGFGQALLTPIEHWEFAAGLRYTHVEKHVSEASSYGNLGNPSGDQSSLLPPDARAVTENNASPEFTLTYRPNADWTIFGSYKFGYKGPGFNAQTFLVGDFTPDGVISPFGGEKVQGYEAGVKAALLDHQINLTATIYNFKYDGLQVSFYDARTNGTVINNGADARTKGVELSLDALVPGIDGLRINGFVAYNDAKYTSFPRSPCYGGQTPATGCSTDALGPFQDLTGARLYHAPKWVGDFGANYETDLSNGWFLALNAAADFSSSYQPIADQLPTGVQKHRTIVDGSIRFGPRDGFWELGILGRNLFNKLYIVGGDDAQSTTPGLVADAFGYVNRPRQVMLQLTLRPMR